MNGRWYKATMRPNPNLELRAEDEALQLGLNARDLDHWPGPKTTKKAC